MKEPNRGKSTAYDEQSKHGCAHGYVPERCPFCKVKKEV